MASSLKTPQGIRGALEKEKQSVEEFPLPTAHPQWSQDEVLNGSSRKISHLPRLRQRDMTTRLASYLNSLGSSFLSSWWSSLQRTGRTRDINLCVVIHENASTNWERGNISEASEAEQSECHWKKRHEILDVVLLLCILCRISIELAIPGISHMPPVQSRRGTLTFSAALHSVTCVMSHSPHYLWPVPLFTQIFFGTKTQTKYSWNLKCRLSQSVLN